MMSEANPPLATGHRPPATVTVAPCAGFCFGVERALNMAEAALTSYGAVLGYGPLIHNPQVVDALKSKGLYTVEKALDIPLGETVIIRTHGVPLLEFEEIAERAKNVVDATCPFVRKAQEAARELSDAGLPVVVAGEAGHPEIKGILSYIAGERFLVECPEDVNLLPYRERYGAVAQTTQSPEAYERILEKLKKKCAELTATRTICGATRERQAAAAALALEVDIMFVVGGFNSANTSRLCELCLKKCKRTYHIETERDITPEMLLDAEKIGITAGASTPKSLVERVREYLLYR